MFHLFRSSAVAVVAAGCAIGFLGGPAADAAPPPSPAGAEALGPGEIAVPAASLTLDLDRALYTRQAAGPADETIVLTTGSGVTDTGDGITLPATPDNTLTYQQTGIRGVVRYAGEIQLSTILRKTSISELAYDLGTGILTGRVGDSTVTVAGNSGHEFADLVKPAGSVRATLSIGAHAMVLTTDLFAAIDTALGTHVAGADSDREVAGAVNVDVNLVHGDGVDTGLITALGLDADIDSGTGVSGLLDQDLDVRIGLARP